MEKTVYGDLLFFVNFCMDFQCLFLTARLLRRRFSLWRGALFAALGALYACAALFFSAAGVGAFLLDLAVCFAMCVGTYAEKNGKWRSVMLAFLIYFGVSFAVGGMMSGAAALLSHIELPLGEGTGDVSTGLFFLLAALGGMATFLWGRFCRKRAEGTRACLRVRVGEAECTVQGMVDTGNLLRDPISARPVAILDARAKTARALFPPLFLKAAVAGDTVALTALPQEFLHRVHMVSAHGVAGERLLFAVLPDEAFLNAGKGEVQTELLIAVSPLRIDTADYEMLLPAGIIF